MTHFKSIICLHGFLGLPADWSFVNVPHIAPNLLSPSFRYPLNQIGDKVAEEILKYPSPRLLIGYSLGGRLLLHALESSPSLGDKVILVSTHFGLENEQERISRIKNDQYWAEKFRHEPWEKVMNDWNQQDVFSAHSIKRDEKDFSRDSLAYALSEWSLGKQQIMAIKAPVLLVVGEKDLKFLTHNKEKVKVLRESTLSVIPNTGHRVIFEAPSALNDLIGKFQLGDSILH